MRSTKALSVSGLAGYFAKKRSKAASAPCASPPRELRYVKIDRPGVQTDHLRGPLIGQCHVGALAESDVRSGRKGERRTPVRRREDPTSLRQGPTLGEGRLRPGYDEAGAAGR